MTTMSRGARFAVATSILATAVAMPVRAQSPAPPGTEEDPSALQEIVVTAQKRSENLQKVPIAVTALTASDIKNLVIDTGVGLARSTPNLSVYSGTGFFSPYLRGVGSQYATIGLESSVATYIDDQYVSRPTAGLANFNDIARIEVLKGPQGTLFGRNAAGGAIRIITNDPVMHWEANAALTYGRFDRKGIEGVVNAPLADKLAVRLAYYHDENDGYVRNIDPTKPRLNDRNIDMLRGKILFEPTESFKLKLAIDLTDKRDFDGVAEMNLDGAPGQTGIALGGVGSPGFYTTSNDAPYSTRDRWHIRQFGTSLRADWDVGGVTLSSISGYRYALFLNPNGEIDAVSVPYFHNRFEEWSRSYSQELQLVSSPGGRLQWLAGAYYFEEVGGSNFTIFGTSIDDLFGVVSGPNVGLPDGGATLNARARLRIRSFAPYAQATFDFTDRLQLLLGARYTSERKTLRRNDVFAGVAGATIPVAEEFDKALKFNKFTPKLTLSYKPARGILLYATYSQGFKSGGINTPSFGAVAGTVKPENLRSYELGWKTEFGNVRFNGAAFYYDYKNLQVQRTDPLTSTTILTNAASAEIYGIESDLTWAAAPRLEFGLGAGWLHARYKNYDGDAYVRCADNLALAGCASGLGYGIRATDFSGQRMPLTPSVSANLRAQYEQPLGGNRGSVLFNALFSYSSRYFYNAEHSLSEPSHHLLSGGVTWKSEDERYRVSVFGENLLDQKYFILKARQGGGGWAIPASPLGWGVRVGVTF